MKKTVTTEHKIDPRLMHADRLRYGQAPPSRQLQGFLTSTPHRPLAYHAPAPVWGHQQSRMMAPPAAPSRVQGPSVREFAQLSKDEKARTMLEMFQGQGFTGHPGYYNVRGGFPK